MSDKTDIVAEVMERNERMLRDHDPVLADDFYSAAAEIRRLRDENTAMREALEAVENLEWVAPDAPDDALVMMTAGAVRKMRRALLSNRGEE